MGTRVLSHGSHGGLSGHAAEPGDGPETCSEHRWMWGLPRPLMAPLPEQCSLAQRTKCPAWLSDSTQGHAGCAHSKQRPCPPPAPLPAQAEDSRGPHSLGQHCAAESAHPDGSRNPTGPEDGVSRPEAKATSCEHPRTRGPRKREWAWLGVLGCRGARGSRGQCTGRSVVGTEVPA